MEDIMTPLADKEQALLRAVSRTGKAATRARLAGQVGIDFHSHAARQGGFVGDVAMQFSKRPLRVHTVALALLSGNALGALPLRLALVGTPCGAFADVCQAF